MKKHIPIALFIGISQILFSQVTDVDGKKYNTGKFGNQVWMLENLNVSKFKNGDIIRQVKTTEEWDQAIRNGEPVWCYYENRTIQNDPVNGSFYGKLYSWHAVIDSRGLAPKGWHIPTLDEWTILFNFTGGINQAGYKLKSKDSWEAYKDWDYDQNKSVMKKGFTGGINYLGFNALPGGYINGLIGFDNTKGWIGCWWSSTENYSVPDIYPDLRNEKEGIFYSDFNYDKCNKDQIIVIQMVHRTDAVEISSECKFEGYSVRCIKD